MGRDLVEAVREDVEPGGCRTLVGTLERVDLLQLAVGLYDDEIGGCEPEGLGEAGAAAQRGQDRGEEPNRHRPALLSPAVEDREEPVGIGRGRSVRTGRRLVPGGVRKKEVDERRFEFGQGVEHRVRIVPDVHGTKKAEVEVAVALLAQKRDGSEDQGVAGASVGEPAVPVIGGPVAVERDTDPDAELVEEVQIARAELQAVGMDP
jgi:hypothetical protein